MQFIELFWSSEEVTVTFVAKLTFEKLRGEVYDVNFEADADVILDVLDRDFNSLIFLMLMFSFKCETLFDELTF